MNKSKIVNKSNTQAITMKTAQYKTTIFNERNQTFLFFLNTQQIE